MTTRYIRVGVPVVLSLCGTIFSAACGSSSSKSHAAGGAWDGAGAAPAAAGSRASGGGDAIDLGGRAASGSANAGAESGPAGAAGNDLGSIGGGDPDGAAAGASGSGGAPGGSCDDIPCPGLGSCVVQRQGSACSRICSLGAYTIVTNEDVARLAALKCDALETTLMIGGTKVSSLAGLESIRQITGDVFINDPDELKDLSGLARLEAVTGNFEIRQNVHLTTVSLPALEEVRGVLSFYDLKVASSIELPALTSVGQILEIAACPFVSNVRMDRLQTVGTLDFALNDVLSTIGLPALSSAVQLIITNNPFLPQCEVDAVSARLGVGVSCTCSGNDTDATCN